jgi:bifunctional non-homologous end joining protein LigD
LVRTNSTATLEAYANKRAFDVTPEPAPAVIKRSGPLLFVVQEHAARRLHYDFRLELDGVLKSWAIPKGLLIEPGEKHLAVHVEDHPMDYASFEGVIPAKQYGAGKVIVWDCGIYSPDEDGELSFHDRARSEERLRAEISIGKVSVTLAGEKLKGSYALVRTKDSWLLIKHRDRWTRRELDPERVAASIFSDVAVASIGPTPLRRTLRQLIPNGPQENFPRTLSPMLAQIGEQPLASSGWLYEPKLDGYRALAFVRDGQAKLLSRNGLDLTKRFPTVVAQLAAQPVQPAIFDGEIIVFENGKPSFNALQNRTKLRADHGISAAEQTNPAVFYAFDILHVAGINVRNVPYGDRRHYLAQCLFAQPYVQLVHAEKDGIALYRAARAAGMEGIVAKNVDSLYEEGKRSAAWRKIKGARAAEFVLGGYTAGQGSRSAGFRSLLLGYWEDGKLRYAGNVGSGFDDQTIVAIRRKMDKLKIAECPFSTVPPLRDPTTWVKPKLVAEIQSYEWTKGGHLRHPVFLRLRDDVDPKRIVRKDDEAVLAPTIAEAPDLVAQVTEQLNSSATQLSITVGGQRISLTQLNKVLWPAHKKSRALTKRDLLRYLTAASPYMLPHLSDRPLTLIRMPDGINGQSFYQKHLEQKLPPFVDTVQLYSKSKSGNQTYLLCNNLATLLWLGQLGTLEFHVWHSSVGQVEGGAPYVGSLDNLEASALNRPDYVVFDIDPYIYSGKESAGAEPELNRRAFEKGKEVAFWLKDVLDALSLRAYVKTSGKTGLHVFVPIERTLVFEQARSVCELIGRHVMAQHPDVVTMDWSVAKRAGKIFFDHNMNVRGKTLNVAYSPRAIAGAPISMPLSWEELADSYPLDFRIDNWEKLRRGRDDGWSDIYSTRQNLERMLFEK